MEEMKSLGLVQLYRIANNKYVITTETGELFIDNVWGKFIFKIKYCETYYALPLIEKNNWVKLFTENGSRYFNSEVLKYYIDLYGDDKE